MSTTQCNKCGQSNNGFKLCLGCYSNGVKAMLTSQLADKAKTTVSSVQPATDEDIALCLKHPDGWTFFERSLLARIEAQQDRIAKLDAENIELKNKYINLKYELYGWQNRSLA